MMERQNFSSTIKYLDLVNYSTFAFFAFNYNKERIQNHQNGKKIEMTDFWNLNSAEVYMLFIQTYVLSYDIGTRVVDILIFKMS